jgi:hypothetical protein
MPQSKPCCAQVWGMHAAPVPQTFGVPPAPQLWPAGHVAPQSIVPPQRLPAMPQLKPFAWQVVGVHADVQVPFVQTWFVGQVPQSCRLPQPSPCMPQVKLCC